MVNDVATPLLKPVVRHWDRRVIPDKIAPNCFQLQETETGKLSDTVLLPENGTLSFLNLDAAAPELQDSTEMFRDYMTGNPIKNNAVFYGYKRLKRYSAAIHNASTNGMPVLHPSSLIFI